MNIRSRASRWNVGGAMDQGAQDGTIREALVVGIENTPDRLWEL